MNDLIPSETKDDESINKIDEPIESKKKEININLNKLYINIIVVSFFLGVSTVALIARITFDASPTYYLTQFKAEWKLYSFFDKSADYLDIEMSDKVFEWSAKTFKKYQDLGLTYTTVSVLNPSKSDINRVFLVYLARGIDLYFYIIFISAYFIIILIFKKFKFNIRFK